MNHDAQATLDAWRAGGLDRRDPVRFRLIEILARRARQYDGAPRRVLDERVATLIQAYRQALEQDAPGAMPAGARTPDHGDAGTPADTLASLTAALAGRPRAALHADTAEEAPRDVYPELAALDDFRALWEQLRTDRQVQESLRQAPGNAGPLNSGHLVHRSLSLMRTLSPGYLRQFMTYLDALSALERLCQVADPAGLQVARLDGGRKAGRARPR